MGGCGWINRVVPYGDEVKSNSYNQQCIPTSQGNVLPKLIGLTEFEILPKLMGRIPSWWMIDIKNIGEYR